MDYSRTDEPCGPLLSRNPTAPRSNPAGTPSPELTRPRRRHASLMRVNHAGEICARALYRRMPPVIPGWHHFLHAAKGDDHLAWTAARIRRLGSHRNYLNPLVVCRGVHQSEGWPPRPATDGAWFRGRDRRQVEARLDSHQAQLPADDLRSRAIVDTMKQDGRLTPWPRKTWARLSCRPVVGHAGPPRR